MRAEIQPIYGEAFEAYKANDGPRARALLERCLTLSPHDAKCLLLLGVVQEPHDTALSLCLVERAVMRDPSDASAWFNLGVIEAERDNLARAADCYRRCISLDPTHIEALGNGCEALRQLELFEEALSWADQWLALAPPDWRSQSNRAICLYHLRRFADAETAFAHARALGDGESIVEWEQFGLFLHEKRFAEAWEAFEHRFVVGHLNGVFHYPFTQPFWRGESLEGKHILVHNEQGLGDQIMFASALPDVVAAAGAVTIVVAPTLVPVFAASFPMARVLPAKYGEFAGDHPEPEWINDLGAVDYHVPIGSLMTVLRRDSAHFERPRTFLRPSDEARTRWATFDPGPGLKVGLCWASNPALFRQDSAARALKKSMPFEAMAPLADVSGAALVSVLNWPLPEDSPSLAARVADESARLKSFDDTAALMERLDVIVTVDTSVAHMAGALGKETWLLLHDFPDGRWEMSSSRSYWYPQMRLFRQPKLGDWEPVIAEVAQELRERIRR